MSREPISHYCFSLVVVKLGRRILLVHERKHELWYFPAGRVEPGETFAEAAIRETVEEAGIDIELEGVLRVEHSPGTGSGRHRERPNARSLQRATQGRRSAQSGAR